ncbi:MAG: hypothetical protein INR72_00915 [Williamsia herbipolensis]|nr:hypothetical protein [Williamsia herbipolensis]
MIGRVARWSIALLLVATVATFSVTRTWTTASGSRVPDVTDVTAGQTPDSAATIGLRAAGVHGFSGASLLATGAALALIALWALSPTYRPRVAGYASILLGGWGIAVTIAFLLGAPDRVAAFGSDVEVRQATIADTDWPWVGLVCFALCCGVGVMLAAAAPSAAPTDPRPRGSTEHA